MLILLPKFHKISQHMHHLNQRPLKSSDILPRGNLMSKPTIITVLLHRVDFKILGHEYVTILISKLRRLIKVMRSILENNLL